MNGAEDLSKQAEVAVAIAPSAGVAGTSDLTATIDMQGYDAVTLIAVFGVITATAVTSVKAGIGDASNGSDAVDISGSSVTVADTDDDKAVVVTVRKPTKRYVTFTVDRGTANAVVSAVAVKYAASKEPRTQGSTVVGATSVLG
jgi:hypothetical protein